MAINRVNLEDVISDAKAALEAGNPDKAIALCHHIFKFYPRCLEASRMLGEAYTEQRLFAEAEQLFVFVLSSDPQDVLGYVDRGFIAYEQGRLDAAILYCERALELDPSIEQLREELLRLYRERKDGIRPQIRMTKVGLANARLRDGLYVQAIEEYTTVLRQTPNRLDVQVGLMEAYWRNRDYNRAEQLAQELIENNVYLVKANLVLWHIYGVRRNQDRAADYLERAHALDPLNLLAERLFEDSLVSNEAMNYISMLGVPAIPRPDSESLAAEVASQKNLVPEWATGRQETDVVLGLRPDLPSATEEDNNLGLDLFALLSDTERHVAQKQEEETTHQQEQPAPPSPETLNSLDELRQITQGGENDAFNLFEEVESSPPFSFSPPVKPAVEPTQADPGAFNLDFSLAKDGDLSLFEEVVPADQSAQEAPQPFAFESDFATTPGDSNDSEIVPFAFDEDAAPPEFLQDIPPFFFDNETATEAKANEAKPFNLEEAEQDSTALPFEPFNFDEFISPTSEQVSLFEDGPVSQPDHKPEDLEATDASLPFEQTTELFTFEAEPEQFSFSNKAEASPVTNLEASSLAPLYPVQPDEGSGLPLYPEPEPQPILIPTPSIPSKSPDAPRGEPGDSQDDTNDTTNQPAVEPPGLPETEPGADPDQPLPMFETEAESYPEPAYAPPFSYESGVAPAQEDAFDQAAPGAFTSGFASTAQADTPVYREPYAFYKRDEQGPIPDFALEQMAQESNRPAFGGLADLEPATESTSTPAEFEPDANVRLVTDSSPLTTSPNHLQENPEMPIRRGQENENDLFDWEREELPDYLQAFVLDEAEIEQYGLSSGSPSITDVNTPPARIRSREDTGPTNGDLSPWLMSADATVPPPPPTNSAENDDRGNIDRLGLMTSALPSWLDTPASGYNVPPSNPSNPASFGSSDFGDLAPFNLEEGNDFGEPVLPPPPFNSFKTPAVNQGFAPPDDLQPFSLDDDHDLTGFEPPDPVPPRPLIDRSKETRLYTRNFGDSAPPVPPTPPPHPAFDLGLDMDDLKPFSFEEFDAVVPAPPSPPPTAQFQAPARPEPHDYAPAPPPPSFAAEADFGDLLPFNLDDDTDMAASPPPPPPPSFNRPPSFAEQFRQPSLPPLGPAAFEYAGMGAVQPFSMADFDELPPNPPPPPARQGSSGSGQSSAYAPPMPSGLTSPLDFDTEPFTWDAEADNIFGTEEAVHNPLEPLSQTAYNAPPAQPQPTTAESDEEKPLRQFEWVKQRTPEPEKAPTQATSLFERLAARRKQQEQTPSFPPASAGPDQITEENLLPLAELQASASQPVFMDQPATQPVEAETFQQAVQPEQAQAHEQFDIDDFGGLPELPDSEFIELEAQALSLAAVPTGITEPFNLSESSAVPDELKPSPLTAPLPQPENAEPEAATSAEPASEPSATQEGFQPESVSEASPVTSDKALESAAPEMEQEAQEEPEQVTVTPVQDEESEQAAVESVIPAAPVHEEPAQPEQVAAAESTATAAPVQTAPEAAIESVPPVALSPSQENLQKAYQFFDRQDYNQSLNFFNQAVKVADKAALPEIVSKLKEIVNSAESSARFHRVLGDAYKKQGQFQAALAEYSKALAPVGGKK